MAVAGVCALALIGLVISEGNARASGQEVLLAMEAVDPRALLGGHYVIVSPAQSLAPDEQCPPSGDWKWIALRREGESHIVVGGGISREEAQRIAPLVARGSFECLDPTPPADGAPGAPGWLRADVGIERFHINQADAERIDAILRDQRPGEAARAYAIISIGANGRARLRGLVVDGERLELSWI
jgi:hypothetical protein